MDRKRDGGQRCMVTCTNSAVPFDRYVSAAWDAPLRFDKVFNKDANLLLPCNIVQDKAASNTDFQYSFIENNVLVQRTMTSVRPREPQQFFGVEVAANLWSGAALSVVIDNILILLSRLATACVILPMKPDEIFASTLPILFANGHMLH